MQLEKLLSVNEVCDLFGVPKSTLYYWQYIRKIPSIKLGKRLMFSPVDIQVFLHNNRTQQR